MLHSRKELNPKPKGGHMFAQFVSAPQELTGGSLRVSLYGPSDTTPSSLTSIGTPKTRRQKTFLRLCAPGQNNTDGDALTIGSTGLRGGLQTSDCWAFVVYSTSQMVAILGHAGRMQLQPTRNKKDQYYGPYGRTIVSTVMRHWQEELLMSVQDTRVVIVRGICGEHFLHNTAQGKRKASPFRRDFAAAFVGENGQGLDLGVVLRQQFHSFGVTSDKMDMMSTCTFTTPTLGSFRRDKGKATRERQNTIAVEWVTN